VGLTADNDKVFALGPEASRPLGHYRNKEAVEEDPRWELADDLIDNDQYQILAAARLIYDAGLAGQAEDDVPLLVEEVADENADDNGCSEWGNETEADAFNDEDLLANFEADAFADEDLFD
jgi:hypothetical protein